MAASSTPKVAYARHLIAVVAEPRPLGILLAGIENGWSEVRSIDEEISQLKGKVRLGDVLESINCQGVRGWKAGKIGNFLKELYKKKLPINLFFLRGNEQAAAATSGPGNDTSVAAAAAASPKRAGDPELITPPTKRVKETSKNPSVASLPPLEYITPSLYLADPEEDSSPPPRLSPAEVRERMENDNAQSATKSRLYVKMALVRAYELHLGSLKIKSLLETDESVKSNPSLVEHFEESILKLENESKAVLNISVGLFAPWELRLLELIKYMIETGETFVVSGAGNKKLTKWMSEQRKRRNSLENGNEYDLQGKALKRLQDDIVLLDRIDFSWKGREFKSFDDRLAELKAYRLEHGNVNVPRLMPNGNLGEWIHRIRREYDDYLNGIKVPSLNVERIAALNELGMIWKIRQGRPRKGDARFRLRRKGDAKSEENSGQPTTTLQDENGAGSSDDEAENEKMNSALGSTAPQAPNNELNKNQDLESRIRASSCV